MSKASSALIYLLTYLISASFLCKSSHCLLEQSGSRNKLYILLSDVLYPIRPGGERGSKKRSKRNKANFWFFLSILFPVLLAGLRWNVGTDFDNYRYMYEGYANLGVVTFLSRFFGNITDENIGIFLISKIAKLLGGVHVFFGIIGLAIVLPPFVFIRKKFTGNSVFLAGFLYLLTLFNSGLNISKQCIAVSFIIFSTLYIQEKKFGKFLLMIFFAFCFHITSVCALPVYFVFKGKNKFSLKRILIIVGVVLGMVTFKYVLSLIGGRFAGYANYGGIVNNRSLYLNLFWLAVFFVLMKTSKKDDGEYENYLFLYFLGVMLTFMGFISPYIKRIAIYYTFSEFILMARLPKFFSRENRLLINILLTVYSIAIFIVISVVLGQGDLVPYNFYWK